MNRCYQFMSIGSLCVVLGAISVPSKTQGGEGVSHVAERQRPGGLENRGQLGV